MSEQPSETIRLNKFVGQSGLCTRREAAHRIKGGMIKENGEVVKDPATQIKVSDLVTFGKKVLKPKVSYVYYLMNKPKKTISETKLIEGEKTLLKVLGGKVKESVTPIEPMDKNDTGLLLLTNDGELLEKLAKHNPKSEVVYHVTLDKALSEDDREKLLSEEKNEKLALSAIYPVPNLEPTDIQIDVCMGQYTAAKDSFIQLGYDVLRMDRLYFNGLTKKDLSRDRFRPLTEKEVIMLKHFS